MNRRVITLALALALASGVGCKPRDTAGVDRAHAEASMAALGAARALHHEADVYEGAGDFERASGAMRRVLALPLSNFEEAEDVRADAWGRLAELDLRRDRPDESLSHVDEGLRATPHESVLQARLHMVRGQALRVLSERATAAGDTATATRRREEALAALERSIEVNGRILGRLTDGGRR